MYEIQIIIRFALKKNKNTYLLRRHPKQCEKLYSNIYFQNKSDAKIYIKITTALLKRFPYRFTDIPPHIIPSDQQVIILSNQNFFVLKQFSIPYLPTQIQMDIVYRKAGFNCQFSRFVCTKINDHLICFEKMDKYVSKD